MSRWVLGLCVGWWMLTACSLDPVKTEFEGNAPLRTYKTFSWLNGEAQAPTTSDVDVFYLDAVIRSGLYRELTARAYKYQTLNSPDFFVSYHHGLAGAQETEVAVDRSLEIVISDGRSRETVWRGRLEQALPVKVDAPGAPLSDHITKVIRQIFNHFPPR